MNIITCIILFFSFYNTTTTSSSPPSSDASSTHETVHLQQRLKSLSSELVTLRNRLHVTNQTSGSTAATTATATGNINNQVATIHHQQQQQNGFIGVNETDQPLNGTSNATGGVGGGSLPFGIANTSIKKLTKPKSVPDISNSNAIINGEFLYFYF